MLPACIDLLIQSIIQVDEGHLRLHRVQVERKNGAACFGYHGYTVWKGNNGFCGQLLILWIFYQEKPDGMTWLLG
jgi:hypothetical protein